MRIPTRTSVISVLTSGKSHVSVLCTQRLSTCLNQSHVQVPYQAVNEHQESWFHVFALLEKAVGEQRSALSLWEEVCAVHSGFIHSTRKYALMFDTAPDHTSVESISCLGLADRLQRSRDAQQEDKGQSRRSWLSGRELESCLILLDF